MCGIVGYIGTNQAAPILLDGLSKLEYRGYDSAGIAVYDGEKIEMVKVQGSSEGLKRADPRRSHPAGDSWHRPYPLGHPRGAVRCERPSPYEQRRDYRGGPQRDHRELSEAEEKAWRSKGYEFVSDTDTEVIAHLLDYYYQGNPLQAVTKVMHRMEGSYALGIIFQDHPDELYAVRKDSPLIAGKDRRRQYHRLRRAGGP